MSRSGLLAVGRKIYSSLAASKADRISCRQVNPKGGQTYAAPGGLTFQKKVSDPFKMRYAVCRGTAFHHGSLPVESLRHMAF